ncbi:hypothetical protein [Streptomyces bambusae]|uniref:hypothetical protein n=1 Tax=Streptomyces bambusae TaxID=1550616 RepID=UPI003FD6EA9C
MPVAVPVLRTDTDRVDTEAPVSDRDSRPDTDRREVDDRDEAERADADDCEPCDPRDPRAALVIPVGGETSGSAPAVRGPASGARPQVSQYSSPPPMSS